MQALMPVPRTMVRLLSSANAQAGIDEPLRLTCTVTILVLAAIVITGSTNAMMK